MGKVLNVAFAIFRFFPFGTDADPSFLFGTSADQGSRKVQDMGSYVAKGVYMARCQDECAMWHSNPGTDVPTRVIARRLKDGMP